MSVYVEETKFYVKTLRQKKMTRLTSTKAKRRMLFAINVEMLFAINVTVYLGNQSVILKKYRNTRLNILINFATSLGVGQCQYWRF